MLYLVGQRKSRNFNGNQQKGTFYRFFVTIFAENYLLSSFNPIFVISVGNYIFNGTKSKL